MADTELTPNQKRAIQARGTNLVVVAGAGAGKTLVLVQRYLSLLAEGRPLPSIVAITFTEKAAREMRDRVRREIERRAASDPIWDAYRKEIDAARISTIHSLCASLLRANPVEACVDPRFQVLQEADQALEQDKAIDDVLTDLSEGGGAALQVLTEYEIKNVREVLGRLLKLGEAVDEAFARLPDTVDGLLADWNARLEEARREALLQLLACFEWRSASDWIRHNSAADSKDKLELVRQNDQARLETLKPNDVDSGLRVIREFAQCAKAGNKGSAKAWEDLAAARLMLNSLRDLARDFCGNYDIAFDENDRRAAELVFLWRDLWQRVRAKYTARKVSQRVLDFDDLEARARALLRDKPEVRARYRAEFSSMLVDEFQDTNAAQRDIVYALADPDEPDRLFIVADGKQSIYGFRGADVSVFADARRDVEARWGREAIIPLDQSFRAHSRLVQAFNWLFARLFAVQGNRAPYELEYEPMTAPRESPAREPLIQVVQISEEGISADDRREREAEDLADRLKRLVTDAFQVWDKEKKTYRRAGYGDIALLFRATTHFATYEDAFKAAGIRYLTLAGKGYYDRPEVRDLIQLLRALDNPSDDLAIAISLRSPLYALSDETLYRLRRGRKPLCEALGAIPDDIIGPERDKVVFAHGSLTKLWHRVGRVSILDLLKSALGDTDYLATLTALADGERQRGNVEKLLALARRTGLVRLSQFNAYLQDLNAQEVREGEAVLEALDAVKLMSIHRAKGLEFPIVVLPDASQSPREDSDTLLVDREVGVAASVRDLRGKRVKPVGYRLLKLRAMRREDAEEKRLLYVAAARAQEFLIVSGGNAAQRKSYLAQILDALEGRIQFDWGTIEVCEPSVGFTPPPAAPTAFGGADSTAPSENTAVAGIARSLPMPTVHDVHSFTPTGLEVLVRDPAGFERRYLEGAPERVMAATRDSKTAHAPAYVIGEMAHQAIQHWRFPDSTPGIEDILKGYAIESGLTDLSEINAAVRETVRLLQAFSINELYREMKSARALRHEVPFVVTWEGRLIHGALDALYEKIHGEWVIADFKTDRLRSKEADARAFTLERYGVQLAMYQEAVRQQQGDVLVRVHYIRGEVTVDLTRTDLASHLVRAADMLR